ncbi:MAG: MFS transporter [Coriobacteriales bacterium]|jgi:MFS family permease|nr:MFS transporter [Coriobacteriales bacterium]
MNKQNKGKKVSVLLLKVAILAVALDDVAAGAISPALNVMIDKFSDQYPITLIMMLTTAPQICLIVFSPIFGLVVNKFRRRQLLFFGLACFLVGGVAPVLTESLPVILILRAVLGVGIATLIPLALVLIDDFFEGSEKDTMMGLNQTMTMIGGTIFQIGGGFLATISWHSVFLIYLFPIWIVIFCFFFVPEPPKEKRLAAAEAVRSDKKTKIPAAVWVLCAAYVLFHICFFNLVNNAAILIESEGFGDSTQAGFSFSAMTMSSFFGGIAYGFIVKRLKKYTMALGVASVCLGFALCFFAQNLAMVIIGCVFAGLGSGTTMPAFMSRGTEVAPPSRVAMSLSLLPAAMGLGQFLSPITFNPVLEALGLSYGRQALGAAAVMAFALIFIYILYNRFYGRQHVVDSDDSAMN